MHNPELTFATPDHAVSSALAAPAPSGRVELLAALRDETAAAGIRLFDLGQPGQGIVHVMGPELGLTLPGSLLVCGDSHTCTHGGLGALAFGVGSTEVIHVLATQTLVQRRPQDHARQLRRQAGARRHAQGPDPALIGQVGAAGGTGYAVEYAGSAIRDMPVEGRLTICNLSIELGAKMGMVAPDETTFAYIRGRRYAPKARCGSGRSRPGAAAERPRCRVRPRSSRSTSQKIAPQITWGTSPEHVIAVDGRIPDPARSTIRRAAPRWRPRSTTWACKAGAPIAGTPVDWVFIGSCTNSRLSDLRAAAEVARGRKVAPGVRAWVVPGSENVKRDAEAEGLDRVFIDAGFEWREPGCSMCLAANGETVPPGQRSVSTSNRNFVGRQGPGARTHLASPAMAAAAAIAGAIADVRTMER